MKQYLFFLAIPVFLLSCQKEFTPEDLTGSGNGGGPSNVCDTYFPLTTGSTWTYTQGGATQINTVTTPDTSIQNKIFKRVSQNVSGSIVTSFFREEDGNVFAFIDLNNNGVASGKVLLNLLKSNAAVGDKWKDTIVVNGFSERFEFEMLEKNVNFKVDTFNFTNVHHVQYKVKLDFPPIYDDELVQITDAWFAKCIGPVETKSQYFFSGIVIDDSTKLKSYSIK